MKKLPYLLTIMLLMLTGLMHSNAQMKDLGKYLTFYASFDTDGKADFSSGDGNIYTSASRKEADKATPGISNPDVGLIKKGGKFGGALEFKKKSRMLTFFKSKGNIDYDQKNWNGTISFWLQIDPETDLEPGFCDPIQITDVSYNDASIWVDFTKDNPRKFRLGVLGDLKAWNPKNLPPDKNPDFESRLIVMNKHPFSREKWTQITITYSNLNQSKGQAKLYVNGELKGAQENIDVPFTWELDKSNIMLGLSYIGLMDELAIFNKPLNQKEVKSLYSLKKGVKSIL